MTTVLAFDTSQEWCSVAISRDGVVVAHTSEKMPAGHSQALLPAIKNLLNIANIKLHDINAITTITGPGSFTGLRVAIATAQGLGIALNIPVIGIDAFKAYAMCVDTDKNILVMIDSQKQDTYYQLFNCKKEATTEAAAMPSSEIFKNLQAVDYAITGSAAYKEIHETGIDLNVIKINSDEICQAISLNISIPEYPITTEIQPFYIKDAMPHKPGKAL